MMDPQCKEKYEDEDGEMEGKGRGSQKERGTGGREHCGVMH
jgi:hypothetical protein